MRRVTFFLRPKMHTESYVLHRIPHLRFYRLLILLESLPPQPVENKWSQHPRIKAQISTTRRCFRNLTLQGVMIQQRLATSHGALDPGSLGSSLSSTTFPYLAAWKIQGHILLIAFISVLCVYWR